MMEGKKQFGTFSSYATAIEMVVIENFGACNMKCAYCFPQHMWGRDGLTSRMPLQRFQEVISKTFELPVGRTLNVRFAGGEPLLAGIKWLSEAVNLARSVASTYETELTFSLQTNATHITPEMASFLVENRFEVGVSIDGPRDINDATRGHTSETLAGFELLLKTLKRPIGIIATISKCNAMRLNEVVDYLESLSVLYFRANLVGATENHLLPSADEWAKSRISIANSLVAKNGRITEYNIAASMRKLSHWIDNINSDTFSPQYGCHAMRCGAGNRLIYFNQRGGAYPAHERILILEMNSQISILVTSTQLGIQTLLSLIARCSLSRFVKNVRLGLYVTMDVTRSTAASRSCKRIATEQSYSLNSSCRMLTLLLRFASKFNGGIEYVRAAM